MLLLILSSFIALIEGPGCPDHLQFEVLPSNQLNSSSGQEDREEGLLKGVRLWPPWPPWRRSRGNLLKRVRGGTQNSIENAKKREEVQQRAMQTEATHKKIAS
jgi:hypothetical protein